MVARSNSEVEHRSLALSTVEIIWIQSLLSEIGFPLHDCFVLWCDNMRAGSLASNPVFHARTKHIEIDLHFSRYRVLSKLLDVRYVESAYQIADILTKPMPHHLFIVFCNKSALHQTSSNLRMLVVIGTLLKYVN